MERPEAEPRTYDLDEPDVRKKRHWETPAAGRPGCIGLTSRRTCASSAARYRRTAPRGTTRYQPPGVECAGGPFSAEMPGASSGPQGHAAGRRHGGRRRSRRLGSASPRPPGSVSSLGPRPDLDPCRPRARSTQEPMAHHRFRPEPRQPLRARSRQRQRRSPPTATLPRNVAHWTVQLCADSQGLDRELPVSQ